MRYSSVVAALFAGSALAAPLAINKVEERDLVYHTKVEVVTVYVTEGSVPAPTPPVVKVVKTNAKKHKNKPKPKPTPTPTPAPAPQPEPEPAPAPAPAPAPEPQPAPEPEPAPSPSPTPEPAPSTGSGNGMLEVANKWRTKYGLSTFTWSDDCAANAAKTGERNGGTVSKQVHYPDLINMGQVIAFGMEDAFELTYVAAWLCEMPNESPLAGTCPSLSEKLHVTHNEADGTPIVGHYEILVATRYKEIGCAWTKDTTGQPLGNPEWQGQWVCNFK